MADLKATLKRKVGPLPVWGWGAVGVTGVGVGLYLRRRNDGISTVPLDYGPYPTDDGAVIPSGGGGGGGGLDPSPGGGDPIPGGDALPPEIFDCPEGYVIDAFGRCLPGVAPPEVFDCPTGYVLDAFGRCVPDPHISTPGTGQRGAHDSHGGVQAKLERLNERIDALRHGGVTTKERAKLRKVRAARRTIRRRMHPKPRPQGPRY